MTVRYRLSLMIISLVIVVSVGWFATGNLNFITSQFWFIAGAMLLVLLSLVDQPHFSKDANVFINGATAWVSLFAIPIDQRSSIWWLFFGWALYLIVSSFVLMALRTKPLPSEKWYMQLVSRINREIGRPEAIFSAFFIWGLLLQFSVSESPYVLNAFLLFWSIFLLLNVPGIAQAISELFYKGKSTTGSMGVLDAVRSPGVADLRLSWEVGNNVVGRRCKLLGKSGKTLAVGTLIDDRVVKGLRFGRMVISEFGDNWSEVGAGDQIDIYVDAGEAEQNKPVGIVSSGTTIGKLVFDVDPRTELHSGQVVRVKHRSDYAYYQIVSATVAETMLEEGNVSQTVRVAAGQLGIWEKSRCTFDVVDWVPQAGAALETTAGDVEATLPPHCCKIGSVPNSSFPVHINLEDTVTHNTALIGVTGSGKSFLAFHLIEALLDANVRVLVLDLTRQHWQYLTHRNPVALAQRQDVQTWLNGGQLLGVHQFANSSTGYPLDTANFVEEAFNWLKANVVLQAGVDAPAKLCIVMEEAHSLVPEWNQIAQKDDDKQVNRTARIVLQGRKFGLGTLLITQRTANVTKTILNQCNTIFALRSFDQTGLDFLRNYMGDEYSQAISTLPDRTAILVGKASSSRRPIILSVDNFSDRWSGSSSSQSGRQSAQP